MDNEFIEALTNRLSILKNEISALQDEIQGLFISVEKKQKQAQHILLLLSAEGHTVEDQDLRSLGQIQISQIVFEQMNSDSKKTPIHYRDLTNEIQSKGILLPGKDPAANLLSHISRDERFVRVAPGTYGLNSWGLEPYKPRKRRRKKSK